MNDALENTSWPVFRYRSGPSGLFTGKPKFKFIKAIEHVSSVPGFYLMRLREHYSARRKRGLSVSG
jgi:hypothetical protein